MAINTAGKRYSLLPALYPAPDATIGRLDRYDFLGLYTSSPPLSGIFWNNTEGGAQVTIQIDKGATDVTEYIFVQDTSETDGSGLTGLAYNTAGLTAYYVRSKGSATAITLATQTVTGVHADGGFVEVDSTNMPGKYRLDLPDAIFASGADEAAVLVYGAANMMPIYIRYQLLDVIDSSNPVAANLEQVDGSATGVATFAQMIRGGVTGSAQTGTLSTTQMTTDLTEATDDHYNGRTVIWLTGALAGEARKITAYTGSSKTVTFETATEAPSNSDTFVIV